MASLLEEGMHGTKKKQISVAAIIACGKLLDEHLTQMEDGNWKYANGWNDKKIAAECGIFPHQVGHIRQSTKGNLYIAPRNIPVPASQEMQSRILVLEQDIRTLETANKNLGDRVTQLEHDITQLKLSTKFKVVG